MMKARRPRMRPRSSLTPIAAIPPMARRTAPKRGFGGSTGAAVISATVASLRRRDRLVGRGDLQEQLLQVARRSGEAHDRQPGRDGLLEQPGGGFVVAPEAELDRAVLQQHRRGDIVVFGESVARRLERLALEQQLDPKHRPGPEPLLDLATRPWARTCRGR